MIIIDSNIFIFCESDASPEHTTALRKLNEAMQDGRIGFNVVVVSEIFHKLRGFFGAVEATMRVSRVISDPGADYLEFTPDSIAKAMRLSRDFNIRINDALIAQQAIEMGASILTDNVKDFGKIKAVKIIPLRASS